MTRFLICGAAGKMGRAVIVAIAAKAAQYTVSAAVDIYYQTHAGDGEFPCYGTLDACTDATDCIIDFSNHAGTNDLLAYAKRRKLPIMLATTGQTAEENAAIIEAAKEIPIFRAANMSLGIATLCALVRKAVTMFPDADIEIVEQHHNQKLDVPSGTALALARVIEDVRADTKFVVGRHENGKRTKEEVGIHSLRLGNVVGIHEVIITTGTETITLKHEAHSRDVFADGALLAAAFVSDQPAGSYAMEQLIETCK